MREGIMGIYDQEETYALRLMEYLNRRANFGMEVRAYTQEEQLLSYLTTERMDLLLTADEHILGVLPPAFHGIIILLSEGQWLKEESPYPVIYKFQSIESILKEIQDIISTKTADMTFLSGGSAGHTEITAVFSPEGGQARTIFGMILAQKASMQGPTLYLDFEAFPGARWHREQTGGLSELIYYLKRRTGNVPAKIQALVNHSGTLDYLAPVDHYKDLEEMQGADYVRLIRILKEESEYDTVILEMGYFSESVLSVMDRADRICLPVERPAEENPAVEAFRRMLVEEGREALLDRLEILVMEGIREYGAQHARAD